MSSILLKIIAMLSMLSDHIATMLGLDGFWLVFGRLAFPLYAFMIVETFRHLKEKRLEKFIVSLTVMAVIVEPAFDYALRGAWFYPLMQNQLLQFLTYGIAYLFSKHTSNRTYRILIWVSTMILNQVLLLGYGFAGIVVMLLFDYYLEHYQKKSLGWRFFAVSYILLLSIPLFIIMEIIMGIQYGYEITIQLYITYYIPLFSPVLLTIPFIALYNGEYGNMPIWFKKFYRYFYVLHLWILAIIRLFL